MHCGQKQGDPVSDRIVNSSVQKLMYSGFSAVNVQGPATGRLYQFTDLHPVWHINTRDAASILKTQLFRQPR